MRKILAIISLFVIVFGISATVSAASSRSFNLYYTNAPTGSHTYTSFTLPATECYTVKETSHSGSCQGLAVFVNGVRVGNITCNALNYGGYPLYYDTSVGSAYFEVSLRHGTGIASINAQVVY